MAGQERLVPQEAQSSFEEDAREHGFCGRVGFGKRPAVLVVDFILGFTDTSSPLGADLRSELCVTSDILRVARSCRVPVIFTTVSYEPSLSDAGLFPLKASGLKSLIRGSRLVEVDPALQRRDDEMVLVKKYASAFFGTVLNSVLVLGGTDTLIITGCTTSGCVRATVVDALQYGYRAIVARDAVGDRWADAHRASLQDIDMKYGDVVEAAEVMQYLRRVASVANSASDSVAHSWRRPA